MTVKKIKPIKVNKINGIGWNTKRLARYDVFNAISCAVLGLYRENILY